MASVGRRRRKDGKRSFESRRKHETSGECPELSNFSNRKVLASERFGPLTGREFVLCTSASALVHDKGKALDPRRMRCILPYQSRPKERGIKPKWNKSAEKPFLL
jgi:hypothetical protein